MVDPIPPGLQAPAVPPKPSIAVLAFTNMSGDPEQEYFSDGLAEDIITALSRISALFVIARNSSFTYKGRAVDVRSVGRELGVRYVLEGSVRRLGSRLRVTAQLIHAESGAHVWAEKFDRDTVDLFLIQDEITRSVAASIDTQIRLSEGVRARPAQGGELEVWAQIRKVWRLVNEFNEEALLQARKLAEAALAMAPNSGSAHQALSVAIDHLGLMREGPRDPGEIDRVRDLALRAVQLSEDDEYAHWALGNAYMRLKDYDRAIASYNRALEINPNCSPAYALLGNVLLFVGRVQDGIDNMEMALRTNPRDPSNFFRYSTLGLAFLMLGDYRAAASWAKRAIDRKPNWLTAYLTAAVAESLLGHEEVARNWVRRYLAIFPSGSLKDLDRFDPTVIERIGYPAILRKLGLPE